MWYVQDNFELAVYLGWVSKKSWQEGRGHLRCSVKDIKIMLLCISTLFRQKNDFLDEISQCIGLVQVL